MYMVNKSTARRERQLAMFSAPLVSVIVTLDSNVNFLDQCLESVLAQSFTDYEIVIVGRRAIEQSAVLASTLLNKLSCTIKNCDEGEAKARNLGIAHARGELIAFISAGDVWTNDKLEKHVLHLYANPNLGVSYSDSEYISYCRYSLPKKVQPGAQTLESIFCENVIGSASGAVIRRQTLKDLQYERYDSRGVEQVYFDEQLDYSDDTFFWMRILLSTDWAIQGLNEILIWRRTQADMHSVELDQQLRGWNRMVSACQQLDPIFVNEWSSLALAYRHIELAEYYASQLDQENRVRALLARACKLDRKILGRAFAQRSIDAVMKILCRREIKVSKGSENELLELSCAA